MIRASRGALLGAILLGLSAPIEAQDPESVSVPEAESPSMPSRPEATPAGNKSPKKAPGKNAKAPDPTAVTPPEKAAPAPAPKAAPAPVPKAAPAPVPKAAPTPAPKAAPAPAPKAAPAPAPKAAPAPAPKAAPAPVPKAAPTPAPKAAPAPAPKAAPPIPRAERELRATAIVFFQSLTTGVPEATAELTAFPFNLDGERIASRSALIARLRRAFEHADLSHLTFYGVQLMPAESMLARHGKPPARLGNLTLEDRWVGIANLGGRGYVAVFEKKAGRWVAVAYTD